MTERERFEAWARQRWTHPEDFCQRIKAPSKYNNYEVQSAWEAWQERAAQTSPSAPKLHVGNLPTLNQDDYPALGAWWVQLWDGDSVFARVYGASPEEAHIRAAMIAEAPETRP